MIAKNIVIWGIGPHAIKNILPSICSVPYLKLYGILSRNEETVLDLCKKYDCKAFFSDTEMLNDDRVDIVFLSTPTGLHYQQGIKILNSNKHFWSEKPIVQSSAHAVDLILLAKEKELSIAEGFMYLFHPAFDYLKNVIVSKRLGEIKELTIEFGLPELERPGFRFKKNLGGGAIFDMGSYAISAVLKLFDKENITIKYCDIKYDEEYNVDLSGLVILQIDKINIILKWSYNISYKNEINIWGTAGSMQNKRFFSKPTDFKPEFIFTDIFGKVYVEKIQESDHFKNMFIEFYKLIFDSQKVEREVQEIHKRSILIDRILGIKPLEN